MKIGTGRADVATAQGVATFGKSSSRRQCNAGEAMATIMERRTAIRPQNLDRLFESAIQIHAI